MKDGVSYLVPFILITSCFALWGFANDITNPMVKAFSKIFRMSSTDGALVQVAFYGGYFAMAFPAAIFIRRFSYKAGVLLGLGLYAFGAFLFYPAKMMGEYYPFSSPTSSLPADSPSWRHRATLTFCRWERRRRQHADSTWRNRSTRWVHCSVCMWR